MNPRSLGLALSVGLATMAYSAHASAAGGTIEGQWTFTQETGGYCNTTSMDCTGSTYLDTQYGVNEPLQHARIEIRDENFAFLGSCSTDAAGAFDCPWSSGSLPNELRVYFRFEDKQQRFIVYQSNGTDRWYYYANAKPSDGLQDIGTVNVPAYGFTSLYDVMQRSYHGFLKTSGLMQSRFTGVKVIYDHPDPGGWANLGQMRIQMGFNRTETINAAHEAGHLASGLAKDRDNHNGYGYLSDPGHTPTSLEWRGTALDESLADLIAVGAYWTLNSTAPQLCMYLPSLPCSNNPNLNMETASGACISTGANNSRTRVSTVRYLWDIIDSANDGEATDANLYDIYEMIDDLPTGTGWGQADSAASDNDQFHQWEFAWQFDALRSINVDGVYFSNCMGYF